MTPGTLGAGYDNFGLAVLAQVPAWADLAGIALVGTGVALHHD
jgi:hypothetical protein